MKQERDAFVETKFNDVSKPYSREKLQEGTYCFRKEIRQQWLNHVPHYVTFNPVTLEFLTLVRIRVGKSSLVRSKISSDIKYRVRSRPS